MIRLRSSCRYPTLGFFDFLLVTSAGHAYTSLGDVLAAAKASPGKLNIGTINVGSTQNLTAVLFKEQAGIDAQIIPFRTTPDAVTALLRKDIDLLIDGYVAVASLIDDGKLRALATTGPTRFQRLANIPTVAEAGLSAFDVTSWNAIFAPSGTPRTFFRH